ncbi:DUF4199 domain-containing protein [Aquirufa regiilacus]|jgi:hypothetical protein|uniref:DUF4199 domain-containing protein n=1 Tax=Aquirufa regiilacus TaxID=3024868 RepID=A0ABU3TRL9_9BACT|nr:DUF4199 domain-containing protein [Aquirufa sp. LEOWEIH-7C]MDU0808317.1 DUF4199 domain-containing protein [Aquirufa sp. LEOWEIH-7C]
METTTTSKSLLLIKWGIIGGLLSFLVSVVTQYSGLAEDFSETLGWVSFLVTFVINVTVLFLALKEVREQQGGFLSYGEGLGSSTLLGGLWGIVAGGFNYIYINFIDDAVIQKQMDLARQRLEDQGLSESQIQDAEKITNMMLGPGVQFITIVFVTVLFMFVLGLIVSGIMKREKPMFDE